MLREELALASEGLLGRSAVHQCLVELFNTIVGLGLHLEIVNQILLLLLVQLDHIVAKAHHLAAVLVEELILVIAELATIRGLRTQNIFLHRYDNLLTSEQGVGRFLLYLIEIKLAELVELVAKETIEGQTAGSLAPLTSTLFNEITLTCLHIDFRRLLLLLLLDPLVLLLLHD